MTSPIFFSNYFVKKSIKRKFVESFPE